METVLSKRIMRRVYIVYLLRLLLSPVLVKCYILWALIWRAGSYVSLGDVARNARVAVEGGGLARFSVTALQHTEIATLGILVLGSIVAVFLLVDGVRKYGLGVRSPIPSFLVR